MCVKYLHNLLEKNLLKIFLVVSLVMAYGKSDIG